MQYGFFESKITRMMTAGEEISFLTTPSSGNIVDVDSIKDTNTFMLKANKTYNIHGVLLLIHHHQENFQLLLKYLVY